MEVAQDVEVGAPHVQVVMGVVVEQEGAGHVHQEARPGHGQHHGAVHGLGGHQALVRLPADEARQNQEARPVDQSRQDLEADPAVGLLAPPRR